jgi:hypothetical protein
VSGFLYQRGRFESYEAFAKRIEHLPPHERMQIHSEHAKLLSEESAKWARWAGYAAAVAVVAQLIAIALRVFR